MTAHSYVPLRIHSPYSISEGAVRLGELAGRLVDWGIPAAAIADTNSIAGVYSAKDALAKKGVQPLAAVQTAVDHPGLAPGQREVSELTLVIQDEAGYQNLTRLMSASLTGAGAIAIEALLAPGALGGVLVLTGGHRGPIDKALRAGAPERARQRLETFRRRLGDRLYVELQRQAGPSEQDPAVIALARDLEIPLVATHETFFLDPDFAEAHDALLCIAQGLTLAHDDRRHADPSSHLLAPDAMAALFADVPDAIANTLALAQRCTFLVAERAPMLPAFPTSEGRSEEEELRHRARTGLVERLAEIGLDTNGTTAAGHRTADYDDRLTYELDVITQMGFPGYFLIVSDFIAWSKANDIPVGPGRGSGAGSLVAWALTITDLDPLRYGLFFERFLNPERVSMPDFDIDFCQDRRDEVIAYVRGKYGETRVAQIGTIGKLQARAAFRDVGRVMQIPFPVVDRYSKLIPNNPGAPISLAEAVLLEPLASTIAGAQEDIKAAFRTAIRLEGLFRNQSTHAAGVVIGDREVGEIVPCYRDQHGSLVTCFDMKGVEKAGLVKFDFLGLKTLDVIKGAIDIAGRAGQRVTLREAGVDDAGTYEMLRTGLSFGVFQLESAGMRKAMLQIQPTCIEDIIALVALYRPGPMENIPAYAEVKAGHTRAEYLHPDMEKSLAETHGIIVYQEQVMELARNLAGYTLGGADLLRRAMGKKIKAEMDAQRAVFQEGAAARGIAPATASEIFDLIAKFANYGFNKSHAAAYAVISFQTAYLRRHHPHAFLAASMNLDLNDVEKIAESLEHARRTGIRILSPEINASRARFDIEHDGGTAVRYGLAAIRGVGLSLAESIVAERDRSGPFESFASFVSRLRPLMNRKILEALVDSGTLDGFSLNRRALSEAIAGALAESAARLDEVRRGQNSLFDFLDAPDATIDALPKIADWSTAERLERQFKAIGFYLDGHPIEAVEHVLKRHQGFRHIARLLDPEAYHPKEVVVGAIVVDQIFKRTKSEKPMMILKISDKTGMAEALAFGDEVEMVRAALGKTSQRAVRLTLSVSARQGDEPAFFLRDIEPLDLERLVAAP